MGASAQASERRGWWWSRWAAGWLTRRCTRRADAVTTAVRDGRVVSRIVCYHLATGIRNYLIEGVSGTGKTSVCNELRRRGYHAIHGDRELAYQGDPETGEPTDGFAHERHIWHVDKVKASVANQDEAVTFYCGGSRNFTKFIDLFIVCALGLAMASKVSLRCLT